MDPLSPRDSIACEVAVCVCVLAASAYVCVCACLCGRKEEGNRERTNGEDWGQRVDIKWTREEGSADKECGRMQRTGGKW